MSWQCGVWKTAKQPGSIEITSEPQIAEAEPVVEESVAQQEVSPGEVIYERACGLCHTTGIGEAPVLGDSAAWAARMESGRDALIASAISGKGIMPPKGGQSQLTDDEVASAVDFIITRSAD